MEKGRKEKQVNEEGQALIELIVFLPLMFTLYSVISGFASAINGSINQQKISRAYFYYRVQNNSTIPKPSPGDESYKTWSRFGMFYIGWKDYFKNQATPVMPCYRVSLPLQGAVNDKCEDTYQEDSTLYIRVGTVYGFCGATFKSEPKVHYVPESLGSSFQELLDEGSCLISR